MSLESITTELQSALSNAPSLGKTLKFAFDEGVVHVDLNGDQPIFSNEDKEADVTIITNPETLKGMRNGSVNPMMAMMTGKLKIKGDMGVAMKLQSLFS